MPLLGWPIKRPLLLAVSVLTVWATAFTGLAPTVGAQPGATVPVASAAPEGSARAWLVADIDTGRIMAGRDPYGAYAPASTIKVLLAMTVLDHLNPRAAVRANATHTDVECSCVGLVPGQVYTTRQLLDAILMVSGNDAANLLGDMLGGYRPAITRMTAKAQSIGARHTRALSPSGLDGPGWESVTTPHDMALIFRAALSYPLIAHILRQPQAQFPGRGAYKTIANQNKMLRRYPGSLGGKTGYTNLAGDTFVTAAQRGGRRLVVVQMKGSGAQYDHAVALLDWGFAQPR